MVEGNRSQWSRTVPGTPGLNPSSLLSPNVPASTAVTAGEDFTDPFLVNTLTLGDQWRSARRPPRLLPDLNDVLALCPGPLSSWLFTVGRKILDGDLIFLSFGEALEEQHGIDLNGRSFLKHLDDGQRSYLDLLYSQSWEHRAPHYEKRFQFKPKGRPPSQFDWLICPVETRSGDFSQMFVGTGDYGLPTYLP